VRGIYEIAACADRSKEFSRLQRKIRKDKWWRKMKLQGRNFPFEFFPQKHKIWREVMKKTAEWIILFALVFSLSACGTPETPDPKLSASEPAAEETAMKEEPVSVPDTVVTGLTRTFGEDAEALRSNNGANIGTEENAARHNGADGAVFQADAGENPFLPIKQRLDEAEGAQQNGNQAVSVVFCPSTKDFGFMLTANANIGITIGEDGTPRVFALENNLMEPFTTGLTVEPGAWYEAFLAIDRDGNFQGALWKVSDPDQPAYFSVALGAYENRALYQNASWALQIGFKGESTLEIAEYCGYTFEGFVKEAVVPEQPEPEPDLNADPMNVVSSVLKDPQVLGGEGTQQMTENMGGMFGGIDLKQPSEDGSCFQFGAVGSGAWMPYQTRLLDVGENRGNTQAFLIRFRPGNTKNLSFNFIGMGEVVVSFSDGNQPSFINVQEFYTQPFSAYMPTDLTLEPDQWYYGLFAFDTIGNFRSVLWEDGNAEGRAACEEKLGEQREDMKDSNWEVVIGFDAGGTLDVESYTILDFESFA
jgi:hypothetical protein